MSSRFCMQVPILSDKPRIMYVHGDEALLDAIQALWEALNAHHLSVSVYFKPYYREMTFEKRKAAFLMKAKAGKMKVDIAVDERSCRNVGFIIGSINNEKVGEVESIFVDEEFRGFGIGDALIKRALAWMDAEGAESKIVEVASGNEQAFGFYKRYGFLPRETVLKQVKSRLS
jgi:ribosomal protein S18 acetylase RimI-like enzyme